jgi:hypothetical protein
MFRLARKPSLWASLFLRVVFVIVAAFAVIVALFFVAKRGTFFMLSLVVFIAIASVWELIRFSLRMRLGAPVVEIERQPLAYGDSAEVRVSERNPRSVREIGVTLVGECNTSAATDISEYRETRVARTRCYEEELMRMKPESGAPLSRVARLQLPKSPPADGMSWTILVDATLKHGDVVEHPYPLRVRE